MRNLVAQQTERPEDFSWIVACMLEDIHAIFYPLVLPICVWKHFLFNVNQNAPGAQGSEKYTSMSSNFEVFAFLSE